MEHGGDIYSDTIEYDFSVNLNPLDCSDVINSIMKASVTAINTYPDPLQRDFRKAVAELEGVVAEEVLGGNGASELLMALIIMIKPSRVMLPAPCFAGYYHVLSTIDDCEIAAHSLVEDKGFLIDETFIEHLKKEADKGLDLVILTNPNNPTGRSIPKEILTDVLEICRKHSIKLIIDESFIRMSEGTYSMVNHIKDYNGLFVINAFTKLFSIPGIRVGYVVSDAGNIERLVRFLPEWNMSVMAQKAGEICCRYLLEENWEMRTQNIIEEEKKYLCSGLKKLGFKVYESDTGFVLFYSEKDVYKLLKEKKILIRDLSEMCGLGAGYYRVAVKKHSENELLLEAISGLL